ncbi:hypothetical protein AB9E28_15515, partial [Rhizobium leguminosarum]
AEWFRLHNREPVSEDIVLVDIDRLARQSLPNRSMRDGSPGRRRCFAVAPPPRSGLAQLRRY